MDASKPGDIYGESVYNVCEFHVVVFYLKGFMVPTFSLFFSFATGSLLVNVRYCSGNVENVVGHFLSHFFSTRYHIYELYARNGDW